MNALTSPLVFGAISSPFWIELQDLKVNRRSVNILCPSTIIIKDTVRGYRNCFWLRLIISFVYCYLLHISYSVFGSMVPIVFITILNFNSEPETVQISPVNILDNFDTWQWPCRQTGRTVPPRPGCPRRPWSCPRPCLWWRARSQSSHTWPNQYSVFRSRDQYWPIRGQYSGHVTRIRDQYYQEHHVRAGYLEPGGPGQTQLRGLQGGQDKQGPQHGLQWYDDH